MFVKRLVENFSDADRATTATPTDFKNSKRVDSSSLHGRFAQPLWEQASPDRGEGRRKSAFAEREQKKIADTDRPCDEVRLSEYAH